MTNGTPMLLLSIICMMDDVPEDVLQQTKILFTHQLAQHSLEYLQIIKPT